jgi:hypothetical protein
MDEDDEEDEDSEDEGETPSSQTELDDEEGDADVEDNIAPKKRRALASSSGVMGTPDPSETVSVLHLYGLKRVLGHTYPVCIRWSVGVPLYQRFHSRVASRTCRFLLNLRLHPPRPPICFPCIPLRHL